MLIVRLEVSTLQSQSHSFPFSSFLPGLGLILVLSHQLLRHRHCPASLPHKVSLEECADKISAMRMLTLPNSFGSCFMLHFYY